LKYGIWYLPWSNVNSPVLTAHRFTYLPPYTMPFYHLDKVEVGDSIKYVNGGVEYEYVVENIMVVESSEVGVEEGDPGKITLYTCTPLWTSSKRLVIVGKLVSQTQLSAILSTSQI
jgi:LPXTG-site transpeptidase (sortase) family protein